VVVAAQPSFIGSLPDVLSHVRTEHGDFSYHSRKEEQKGAQFHFSLPPAVASAMSALHDVGGLEEGTAMKEDLDELDKKARFRWTNTISKHKQFESWNELVRLPRVYLSPSLH
jgi:hypothetical protein